MKPQIHVFRPRRSTLVFLIVLLGWVATAHAGKLSVQQDVKLPVRPAAVWALVGAFSGLDRWLPPVRSSTTQGTGRQPDDIRMLNLASGATIKEKLMQYDDQGMSYQYRILESPLPVKDYVSTIKVEEADNGHSKVVWSSTFEAAGASDEKARDTLVGIYRAGLDYLADLYN